MENPKKKNEKENLGVALMGLGALGITFGIGMIVGRGLAPSNQDQVETLTRIVYNVTHFLDHNIDAGKLEVPECMASK